MSITPARRRRPEGLSVVADAHSFRSGVTTFVDTGTAGGRHFRHFKTTVIDRQQTRIFAYINIVDQGMLGDFEQNPAAFDADLCAATVLAYPRYVCRRQDRALLDRNCRAMACTRLGRRSISASKRPSSAISHVMYDFWPRPGRTYEDLILKKARPGDIHTHVSHSSFRL